MEHDLPDIPINDDDCYTNPFEESTSIFRHASLSETSINDESSLNPSPEQGRLLMGFLAGEEDNRFDSEQFYQA